MRATLGPERGERDSRGYRMDFPSDDDVSAPDVRQAGVQARAAPVGVPSEAPARQRLVPWSLGRALSGLLAWLFVCLAAGLVGALAPPDAWYEALSKTGFTPPNAVFAPVWAVLYILNALAAWRVWERRGFRDAGFALTCFLVQLVLNALWAPLFFGMHAIAAALFDLLLIGLVSAATAMLFWSHERSAALLLAPYGVWLCFAGLLNSAFFWLNT